MSHNQPKLRQLLQLAADQLRDSDAAALHIQISHDPLLQRRWQRIEKRWAILRNSEGPTPQTEGTANMMALVAIARSTEPRDLRHAEAIAAFVEGRSNPLIERRIEAKCWSNAAWLSEVVATYFDHCATAEIETCSVDPDRLSSRLLVKANGRSTSHRLNESKPTRSMGEDEHDQRPRVRVGVESPPAPGKTRPATRSALRRYWPSFLTAAIVLFIASLAWLLPSQRPNITQSASDKPPTPLIDPLNRENDNVPSNANDRLVDAQMNEPRFSPMEVVAETPETEPNDGAGADAVASNVPADLDSIFDSFDVPPVVNVPLVESPNTAVAPPLPQPVSITWKETKGILATRPNAEQPWQGLETGLDPAQRFEFASLPGSWAQGELAQSGKLTISDNSQFRIWRTTAADSPLHLAVGQGQVALVDMPDRATLEISAGSARWLVSIQSPKTAIAVDLDELEPRLQVDAGEALVNGIALSKGEEVAWRELVAAEKTRSRPRWIQSPPASVRNMRALHRDIQQRLAISHNVIDDLRQVSERRETDRANDQVAAARMLMSFEPQQYALTVLESSDATLGKDVLLWLFAQDPRVPPARPIWAAIVRRTQSPEKVRQLINWIELAHQRSRVPAEAALTMTEWLEDEQFFFRRSGQFFLALAFGNRVEYDPGWPAELRAAAAKNWRDTIAKHYRSIQRRDGANQRSR